MSKLAEYKPVAFNFPDSLNLFQGGKEHATTFGSDYADGISAKSNVKFISSGPPDLIKLSSDGMEKSTTLQDAYRPYSGKNYVPTAAAREPTIDGKLSMVKTTKAIHIPARPKSQIKLSADKMGNMTSYSYQFAGEASARDAPFPHKEELPGPNGDRSFVTTNGDYSKRNYGRPHISYIPDTGLFDKTSLGEGTTHSNHFAAPPATKEPNLRPSTGILLGKDTFVPRSCYRKQFDGIKAVYNIT